MTRPLFGSRILESVPPWLRRTHGARVLGAIGDVVDAQVQRAFEVVMLRFPRGIETTALPYIGRDRRIRRGPAEPASSYARRMLTWWDDHRQRGGPHALLRQLHAYLLDYAPGQIDLVYQSGTRFIADETTGEITRSDITWGGDGDLAGTPVLLAGNAMPGDLELRPVTIGTFPLEGRYALTLRSGSTSETVYGIGTSTTPYGRVLLEAPGVVGTYLAGPASVTRSFAHWARIWIFVHLGDLIVDELLTEGEDELLLEDGDELEGEVSVFGGVFGPDDEAVWTAIPREWSAAHVQRTTVVLLQGDAVLVGYPPRLVSDPPETVGPTIAPVILTIEGGP